MKKKRVWRYYCEYCKKSGCSSYHMQRHEIICTMNPDRHCGMCDVADIPQQPMEDLISSIGDGKSGIEKLRELTENCPACILAAIRQSGVQKFTVDADGYLNENFITEFDEFDFKQERDSFWSEINAMEAEKNSFSGY